MLAELRHGRKRIFGVEVRACFQRNFHTRMAENLAHCGDDEAVFGHLFLDIY